MPANTAFYLDLIAKGLPAHAGHPKTVLIAGAGMAGLVAAYELKKAGHHPVVLEAQQRVGGRVFTLREPFTHGLYGEAGAMRIPRSHLLTLAYVDTFKLPTLPFTSYNPRAFCYLNGERRFMEELESHPDAFNYPLAPREQTRTAAQLWNETLQPFVEQLNAHPLSAWDEITSAHDQYSVREFLEQQGWSEGAIERFGLLFNQEAMMNSSFLELLREEVGQYYNDLVYIPGGNDQLPYAFLPYLKENIHFGARVTAIDQAEDHVTLHYQTPSGRFSAQGDYAVLTIPFPVMRHIEVLKPFSREKQRAIRQLHYDASAKVFLQCKRRFWEEDDGIFGGGSVTDLANRNLYYPDHGRESGRGVLLASYTWSEDAQRWGSLAPDERIRQVIENVSAIHPQAAAEVEVGASMMWHDDPYSGGAFALFDPGQQTLLHTHIHSPEGRIHFAGEHTSLYHAWIQGAIESGLRAAHAINALET